MTEYQDIEERQERILQGIDRVFAERDAALARAASLEAALAEAIIHMEHGHWSNGNKDFTGSVDEGDVLAYRQIEHFREVLSGGTSALDTAIAKVKSEERERCAVTVALLMRKYAEQDKLYEVEALEIAASKIRRLPEEQ